MDSLFDLPFEDEPPEKPAPSSEEQPASPADPSLDIEPRPAARTQSPPPARTIYSVSELTTAIRECLESQFFEVWVEGEVSNYRLWNGLAYFTLKDATGQLRVVMFRTAVRRLRFALQDGTHVVARGRVTVYESRGECQLVCEHVEPKGLGALQLAFEQLKKKLTAEGLFDAGRKRPLPVLPRKIGVVTSIDGAALRDILRVLSLRHANVHVVIRHARVQGEGAAAELARAIAAVSRVPGVDVVIAGRGGGSIEDLWAFNEEVLVRAIAACPVPLISAVGHEIDWTIADMVADLRAATPSNAAELVIARTDEFLARIDRCAERLRSALFRAVEGRRSRVHALTSRRGLAALPLRVASRARRVDDLAACLDRAVRNVASGKRKQLADCRTRLEARDPHRLLAMLRTKLVVADGRLRAACRQLFDKGRTRLATTAARLDSLSPLAVLGRGYALCWSGDGRVLLRAATPELEGTPVRVTLARGQLLCDVRRALTETNAAAAETPRSSMEPS